MAQSAFNAHLEWIRDAEKSDREGDYESAARLFLHVSAYYGIAKDESNRKKFAVKSGESLLKAGEMCLAHKDIPKAIVHFIRAVNSFRDSGDHELIKQHKDRIGECYAQLRIGDSLKSSGDLREMKAVGDYFAGRNELETAVEVFQILAEKARAEEKHALAAGLYRDVGDCHRSTGNHKAAARSYGASADMFILCENFFEAARHYCESSFQHIFDGNFQEASIMAAKAGFACDAGKIDVILNDLSEVCRLMSQRSLDDAEARWGNIRRKFKKSYVDMVESCFRTLYAQETP